VEKTDSTFARASKLLEGTRSLFVLTGAGISAESGVPTFRGENGLWRNYSAEQLATPEAFDRDPGLVWEWYHWRQSLIGKASPNPGHRVLAAFEERCERFLMLTQNVDNLHQRAGSKKVLELHGNIFRARCLNCGRKVEHGVTQEEHNALPRCECGGLLRPDVVWFGELIPADVWHDSLVFLESADVALICGTSGVVWPAAMIPNIACERGLKTIEINLEPTAISSIVDVSLIGKAGEILPRVLHLMDS
jgi:NAD-dependent deacetylase